MSIDKENILYRIYCISSYSLEQAFVAFGFLLLECLESFYVFLYWCNPWYKTERRTIIYISEEPALRKRRDAYSYTISAFAQSIHHLAKSSKLKNPFKHAQQAAHMPGFFPTSPPHFQYTSHMQSNIFFKGLWQDLVDVLLGLG
ncbi:hypothetical protein VTL71DRAFT_5083 [Oculimacula yallundae]|uniref:Maturase K n=1 Tax=Oculimacula yallundae TaxID=86028 RepID=A0ABR4C2M9_9HELO